VAQALTAQGYEVTRQTVNRWARGDEMPTVAAQMIARLFAGSTSEIEWMFNVGPSRWLGAWWLLAGIPLAAWLTWRGRVGLASLAVSPYLLPYYLMFGVLAQRVEAQAVFAGRIRA
jgi:hypothetical protein